MTKFTYADSTSLPPLHDSAPSESWGDESEIEAVRPKSLMDEDLDDLDDPDTPIKPWLRAIIALGFALARMCWNILAEILRVCGLGRSPDTCVTFRQRLWLFINARILEEHVEFTLEPAVARQFQAEICDDPFAPKSKALFLRCPLLSMLGEKPLMWDVTQRLTFLSSNGRFLTERHGTVTKDGHLLVIHHIVRIPESVVQKLQPMTHVSLLRCLTLCLMERMRSPKAFKWSRERDTPLLSDHDVATSTTTVPSTEDTMWRRSSVFLKPQVALFQHGLLESSTNWLVAAAPVDEDHAWTLRSSLIGILWIWREVEDLLRCLRQIFIERKAIFDNDGPGPRPDASLIQSMPFYLMLAADKAAASGRVTRNGTSGYLDVWLGNSRGNSFSRLPPQPDLEEHLPPMGYRSGQLNELLEYAEIFGHSWTYHDMAILDVDALFDRVACLTQNKTWAMPSVNLDVSHGESYHDDFRPLCFGFSQGAATFLLYTAFKQKLDAFLQARKLPASDLSPVQPSCLLLFSPPIALSPHNSTAIALFQKDRSVSAARRSAGSMSAGLKLDPPTYRKSLRLSNAEEHWTVAQARAFVNWLIPVDRMVAFFFYMAKKHLGIVAVVVEFLCTCMPNAIYPRMGHFFVREMLQFYTDPLTPASRRWVYPLTPSGLTSHKNMELYMHRIMSSEPLGYRFGTYITWPLPIHSDQDTNRAIEDHFSHRLSHLETFKLSSDICPINAWLGRLDNIAWPERSAEIALSEVPRSIIERVPLMTGKSHPRIRGEEVMAGDQVINEAWINSKKDPIYSKVLADCAVSHDVKVRLMEGLGHLDFCWGSQRCKDVYPVVWKEIKSIIY